MKKFLIIFLILILNFLGADFLRDSIYGQTQEEDLELRVKNLQGDIKKEKIAIEALRKKQQSILEEKKETQNFIEQKKQEINRIEKAKEEQARMKKIEALLGERSSLTERQNVLRQERKVLEECTLKEENNLKKLKETQEELIKKRIELEK